MDLPEPLSPWASQLSIFPRDLALSVGPLLRRLSSAIGPLDPHRHGTLGEMDGFDGLAHRGSYERLLMSEWLLADEVPDEFLRRAAAMEHTFLRPARPEPGGSRISVAVFDAGPSQLGAPRIAHLAALLVLERRASAAGVRFAWGILQRPEGPLVADLHAASVRQLLDARGAEEATQADLAAWRKRVGEWRDLDDFWVVGSGRLASSPAAQGASWLVVRDVLDPSRRSVAAAVHRGAVGANVVLDLPPEPACARLLRDPFSAVVAETRPADARHAPASNLVFSGDGVKLFARAGRGGLVQYPVPNSPRHSAGPPKLFLPGLSRPLLAVGRLGKSLAAVTAHGKRLELHHPGHRHSPEAYELTLGPMGMALPVEPGPLGPCLRFGRPPSPDVGAFRCVLLAAGQVLIFVADEGGSRLALSASAAIALAPHPDGVVYVRLRSEEDQRWEAVSDRAGAQVVTDVSDQLAPAVFFGFGGAAAHADFGLMAVRQDGNTFRVWHAGGTSRLVAPAGMRAVGVVVNPRRREPGLLALENDSRTLLLVGQAWTRRLPRATAEIRHVAVSPTSPTVAYSTTHGDVVIFSLEQDTVLYRSSVEVAPRPGRV